jgi:hypothetical protein
MAGGVTFQERVAGEGESAHRTRGQQQVPGPALATATFPSPALASMPFPFPVDLSGDPGALRGGEPGGNRGL